MVHGSFTLIQKRIVASKKQKIITRIPWFVHSSAEGQEISASPARPGQGTARLPTPPRPSPCPTPSNLRPSIGPIQRRSSSGFESKVASAENFWSKKKVERWRRKVTAKMVKLMGKLESHGPSYHKQAKMDYTRLYETILCKPNETFWLLVLHSVPLARVFDSWVLSRYH